MPTSYGNGAEKTSLVPDVARHIHETAVDLLLFDHDAPILGVVSDYLRYAQLTNDEPYTSQTPLTWGNVIASFLKDVQLFDKNSQPIKGDRVKSVTQKLFGTDKLDQVVLTNPPLSFINALSGFLGQYFAIDLEKGTATILDQTMLNVPLGSAQRAVTPYAFGNCMEGCRFCYVDRTLSPLIYPHNWTRDLEEIQQVLTMYDPDKKTGPPQARMAMMDREPTEHPEFVGIPEAIAKRDPLNQIPIVTHGGNLTPELLDQIANNPKLKDIVLFQVSLNSSDVQNRRQVMAGKGSRPDHHEVAIQSLEEMAKRGIAFDVSIVAATNWVPMEDIIRTQSNLQINITHIRLSVLRYQWQQKTIRLTCFSLHKNLH